MVTNNFLKDNLHLPNAQHVTHPPTNIECRLQTESIFPPTALFFAIKNILRNFSFHLCFFETHYPEKVLISFILSKYIVFIF